jgi:Flp pilus assembly protein TadD
VAIVARGTVQDRPWGRTLSFVADRRFSGELVVDSEGRRYSVGFDDGAVVAAASPLATDAAVRVALTSGLVTSSQVAEINRMVAARPELDEVDAVAAAAKLGTDQIDRLRRRVIAHRAIRGFALERGDFVLTEDRQLAFTAAHAIDVRALIYLGARTHMTEQRLLQELARVGPGFQLRADAIGSLPQYGFGEAEKPVLAALRAAPVAVLDLDAVAPELDARTVRAVVYALAVTNALEIAQASVGHDRARTPPPSAMPDRRRPSSLMPAAGGRRPRTDPPLAPGSEPHRRTSPAGTSPPSAPGADHEVRSSPGLKPPPTALPGVEDPSPPARTKAESSSPARTKAESSSPARTKAGSSSPSIATRGRSTSLPPMTVDGTSRRRPGRRSSLPPIEVPHATEVRNLIRDRAALLQQGADHYALLGVEVDAPAEEIRQVYFTLARQLHPDRITALGITDETREAQRLFAQINTAFAVLSSPGKRADYRRTLDAGGEAVVRAQADQAEALTRKILAAEEKFRIGEMALRRDQTDVALAHFREAVELNPDEADHHALLGWAMFVAATDKAAAAKQSRALLEKASRMAAKAIAPRFYLGRMARMLGRDREAIELFQEVLRLSPGHVEASSELRLLEQRQTGPKDPVPKGGVFGRFKKS